MADFDPAVRTRTMARIVGPYLAFMGVMVVARQAALPALFSAFMQDAPLVLATGAFTLMAGLTIIGAHHHWKGASAIVISLIGIVAALKGASLMIAPDLGGATTAVLAHATPLLPIVGGVVLLVGLWLSFVGWVSKARNSS